MHTEKMPTCKKCGGDNLQLLNPIHYSIGLVATSGCLLWFIITIPLSIILLITAIVLPLLPFRQVKCRTCKITTKVTKQEFKEMKKSGMYSSER